MADKDRKDEDEKRRAEEDAEDEELSAAPKAKAQADEKKAAAGEKKADPDKAAVDEEKAADEQADADEEAPEAEGSASDHAEDEEAEAAPAPKAAAQKKASDADRGKPARSPRLSQRRSPPKGSLAKSLMLFVIIVGGLIVVFTILGKDDGGGGGPTPAPKWAVGQTVDLEVTVVQSDSKDLACASVDEIGGKKCQFANPNKAQTPPITDDKAMLKPYTTTDRIQFVGAGLWSDAGMPANKLPNTRFSVKCKFKVEGKLKNPGIRWNSDGPWYPQNNDWYAGSLSSCAITPP